MKALREAKVTRKKGFLVLVGAGLWTLAIVKVHGAEVGLEITQLLGSDPPTTVIRKVAPGDVQGPLVLVAHGFASSEHMMRGFSLTLAHAGYDVVAWDSKGHGRNPQPFPAEFAYADLLSDAEAALAQAQTFLGGEPKEVAVLGHSMGSGIALDFGLAHPETAATIAVSPVPREVARGRPRNLLLMAGSREPRFVSTAQSLLQAAGGEGGDPKRGTARAMRIIPGVEHITILYSPRSHAEARAWLEQVFDPQPNASAFHDRRPAWFGLGILGMLLLGWGLLPDEAAIASQAISPPAWRAWLAPAVGTLSATALMALGGSLGVDWSEAIGLLVGGFQLAWFSIAGVVTLAIRGGGVPWPRRRELAMGLALAGLLWLGVGLVGDGIWASAVPIAGRMLRLGAGVALAFPWFLAVGLCLRQGSGLSRFLGWAYHAGLLVGGTMLAVRLIPGLGVLALALPVLPLVIGLLELAAARVGSPWSYASAGALFVAWALSATFPLV